jgi:hypothetical protein
MLRVSIDGKTRSRDLSKEFKSAGIDPTKAKMRMDGFPPKMNFKGSLLYFYSPGAERIVVKNPRTKDSTWIKVSENCRRLRVISFVVKNGIIAITGVGANFIDIIGLINLSRSDGVIPVGMNLSLLLNNKFLLNPKIKIKENKVYITDPILGNGKKYFYEVVDGAALPITVEAD